MITQDFSRDLYQEVKRLDENNRILIVASSEYILQNTETISSGENNIMKIAEILFNKIFNEVKSGIYTGSNIYNGEENLKIIIFAISEDGKQNILSYLRDTGIYND
jgi:isocitrate dehydrogenase